MPSRNVAMKQRKRENGMAQKTENNGGMPWHLKKNDIDIDALPSSNDRKGLYRVRKEVEAIMATRNVEELTNADIINFETIEMYGKRFLSVTEGRRINDTLTSMGVDAIAQWGRYVRIYNRIIKPIGNEYVTLYCNFERQLNKLAGDVALWISYNKQARNLTRALRWMEEHEAMRFIVEMENDLMGAKLVQEGDTIRVDADGEGNLYEKIIEASRDTAEALRDVKNIDTALWRYLSGNSLEWMLPMNVQCVIPMVYDYRKYLSADIPDAYFMSEARKRMEKGESLSDRDMEMAVFPDFDAIAPDEECVEQYIGRLSETNEI